MATHSSGLSFYKTKFIKTRIWQQKAKHTKKEIKNPKSAHLHHFRTSLMMCKRPGSLLRKALHVCLSNSHTAVKTAAVLPWDDPKFQWVVWAAQGWTRHVTMWQWVNTEQALVRMIRISALHLWKTRTFCKCAQRQKVKLSYAVSRQMNSSVLPPPAKQCFH